MRLPLVSVLGVALAALVLTACDDNPREGDWAAFPGSPSPAASPSPAPTQSPESGRLSAAIRGLDIPRDLVSGQTMGSDDAPLKLTMFEDFQCPFCLRFTAEDEPVLIEEYVKTGKLQLEFVNFPVLGRESVQAAVAGECAAQQDMFWEYHKELFATQADANQDTDEVINQGRFSGPALHEIAGAVGLDRTLFDACLFAPETLAIVEDDRSAAQAAGLGGTPNFLVNGEVLGLRGTDPGGPDDWRALLDDLLAEAE